MRRVRHSQQSARTDTRSSVEPIRTAGYGGFGKVPGENKMKNKKSQRGSALLLEMLVVLLIMEILMTISLPNVQRVRISMNQSAAVEQMREVAKAELFQQSLWGGGGFRTPAELSAVGFPATCDLPNLLPGEMTLPISHGYVWAYTPGPIVAPTVPDCTPGSGRTSYTYTGTPQDPANPRSFFVNSLGIVRYSDSGPANASSEVWVY